MNHPRKINLISNRNFKSRRTSMEIISKFKERGILVSEKYDPNAELNICVGGDGSFLRAVHRYKFPSIPFIGINTGHLGFFQEIKPENIDDFIMAYMKKEFTKEEIYLVDSEISTKKKNYPITGVNEIVIKGIKSKVVHLDLSIDGNHLEKFSGDGIIISTPVGSTAYSFSAGGSIIYPSLKTLQITPIAPINSSVYRSLASSAVVPGNLVVTIRPELRYKNSLIVVNDGIELKYNDVNLINFHMSGKKIYKLNFDRDNYWNNLKSKFL